MEENKKMVEALSSIPSHVMLSMLLWAPIKAGWNNLFSTSLHNQHWKKKLLNSNLHYRKHPVKDHKFFLYPSMTQPFKPCNFVVYLTLIGYPRNFLISDGLISQFHKQFDFLTVMRQLNSFKSHDHTRAVQHVVSWMNNHIQLLLKASKSKTNMLKSFETKLCSGTLELLLGWHLIMLILLTMWNVTLMSKTFPRSTKLLSLEPQYTSLLPQILVYSGPALSYHLPSAEICLFCPQAYHQLCGGSSEFNGDKVVMHPKKQPDIPISHDIKIPIDHQQLNLPIVNITAWTKKEFDMIGPHFKSTMVLLNCILVFSDHWNVENDEFK